jgi:transmembrane sensor
MSDVTSERARTEAAAWFARLNRLSVTTDSLREFRDWKQRKGNAAAYAEIVATWEASGKLGRDPDIQALTRAAFAESDPAGNAARMRPAPATLALGGVALACAGMLAAWLVFGLQPVYRTGVGEQRLVVLSDGSRVRLNTDSAIRVGFGGNQRRVELSRGEAFFEVKHDPSRPFVVLADGARITDLGTKFNVRRTSADVRVTLVEGEVQVAARAGRPPATLAPNQELVVSDRGRLASRRVDAAQASSWTTGRLVFHGEALKDAVAEVNRYSTAKIVLDGPPQLADQPVSGVFDAGDTASFVAAARTLFALQSTVDSRGSVHLTPGQTNPST